VGGKRLFGGAKHIFNFYVKICMKIKFFSDAWGFPAPPPPASYDPEISIRYCGKSRVLPPGVLPLAARRVFCRVLPQAYQTGLILRGDRRVLPQGVRSTPAASVRSTRGKTWRQKPLDAARGYCTLIRGDAQLCLVIGCCLLLASSRIPHHVTECRKIKESWEKII
jgi:hypothetical protein